MTRHTFFASTLFAGAAAGALFFAPGAVAQPGACATNGAAVDGEPCTTSQPKAPALTAEQPPSTGPDTAGCIPGRLCGVTNN
jgi:hypothetical protein